MGRGVVVSVLASVLFGFLYYFSTLLHPLSGEDVFGWRMTATFPFMTLFLVLSGQWGMVWDAVRRVAGNWRLIPVVLFTSTMMGFQLWIFLWGPVVGRALPVSQGYFLLPLVMVVVGRVLYKDKLTVLQLCAALLAAVGVGHELIATGGLSWETMLVAFGYPLYFIVRRHFKTDNLGGLWMDMALIFPVAIAFVVFGQAGFGVFGEHPDLYWKIVVLGAVSAAALSCYILASKYLDFSLFGLLSYLEPVLLLVVALLLGETIKGEEWFTQAPIWVAVGLLAVDGVRQVLARRKRIV
nr:EamA family transporter RarD [Lysinibacter cavernae]